MSLLLMTLVHGPRSQEIGTDAGKLADTASIGVAYAARVPWMPERKPPAPSFESPLQALDGVANEAVPAAPPADRVVHAALLAGDERVFRELIRQYHGRLVRLARVFVSSDAVAEEVAQETWLAVSNGLASFEGRSTIKTWIFKIASNRAKTRAVREGRSLPFSALGEASERDEPALDPSRFKGGAWHDPPVQWDENTPEKLLLRRELHLAIRAAIEALPAGQRAVATLRDLEGLDSEDVCSVLGISETNQRVLLHRARAKLRQVLEAHFRGAE